VSAVTDHKLPTTLSKGRFTLARECPRKLAYVSDDRYVNARNDDEFLEALAEGGHQVGALAKLMYPDGIEVTARAIDEQVRTTEDLLARDNVTIFEATFRHGLLVARVDVLVKTGAVVDLIEVKSKSFGAGTDSFWGKKALLAPWKPYLYDVAFQTLVLRRSQPTWTVRPFLMLVNRTGRDTRGGIGAQVIANKQGQHVAISIDPDIDISTLDPPLLLVHDVSREVSHLFSVPLDTPAGTYEFDKFVDWLAGGLAAGRATPPYPGNQCKKCEFYCAPGQTSDKTRSGWAECMEASFGKPGHVARSATALALYNHRGTDALLASGRLLLTEFGEDDIEIKREPGKISGSHRNLLQLLEARHDLVERHLEAQTLRAELGAVRFPLHFIDFETSRPVLPFHRGGAPYELVLFQFSHHEMDRQGSLRHATQCLMSDAGVQPSIAVVRKLREALGGDNGTVIHWWDHEKTVLNEVRGYVDASREVDRQALLAFIDSLTGTAGAPGRLLDLGRLVLRTAFFAGTEGRSSIKKVLPAVLAQSPYLRDRYSRPIYGTPAMASLNYGAGQRWWIEKDGRVVDPYELLDPMFEDQSLNVLVAAGEDETTGSQEFIANGGAAMVAYGELQRPALSPDEREKLRQQLARYCELDTLAMVMVYEAIREWIDQAAAA
jgi:hypothetical protein